MIGEERLLQKKEHELTDLVSLSRIHSTIECGKAEEEEEDQKGRRDRSTSFTLGGEDDNGEKRGDRGWNGLILKRKRGGEAGGGEGGREDTIGCSSRIEAYD